MRSVNDEEGSSATDSVTDVTDFRKREEGRRKKEEGRRKKEKSRMLELSTSNPRCPL
ncbi:hypothetical protein QUA82_18575 [Microcoleus sp. F8-D3]